jgi:DNA-binding CsgD family transcriptional regulator
VRTEPAGELRHRSCRDGPSPLTGLVPINSLQASFSPRLEGESTEHAEMLAASGIPLPPILVHRPTMRIIDGMHRLRAARLRGEQKVEVEFFEGDEDEAFVAAVRANIAHGLPLTLADREAAAIRIISSHSQRSDRWIAQVTGLAAGTVAAIRRRSEAADNEPSARMGRDGRVRPLNTADGRLKARDEMTRRPDASLREIARIAGISPATANDVRNRMRRGDDPVPRRQGRAGPIQERPARESDKNRGRRRTSKTASADLDSLLQMLKRDPSMRYTESGRTLLQWLQFRAYRLDPLDALIEAAPPHCGYLVASVVRRCAEDWMEFASALELRLQEMPSPMALQTADK